MNNLAFQIYGLKKTGIFQSTWDTTLVSALGAEQAAISASGTGWALNTGATNLNVGGYKHTVGSTTNLTTTLNGVIMQMYKITYTISSRTAGSVTINYGGVSTSGITSSASVDILAIATTVFSITPTSDFDGVVSISVKTTSSATNQVKLPLPNSGTYNIWVDWGDGTYNNITSYNSVNTLHTYPAPGIYTVRITGDRFSWQFANLVDRLKIKTVSSWGKLKIGGQSFYGCSNVTMSGITDVPDLTGVTSLQAAFQGCSKITTVGRMNEWNTSSVTIMVGTFNGSVLFNQCIGGWNVSKVTTFESMFSTATAFNNGFASGIANQLPWNTSACTTMTSMFSNATEFNSNLGTGTTPWDVSKVTTFASMFQSASNFNNGDDTAPINNWNINTVSNVSMESMFNTASKFNRDISSWNVSKVTNFTAMFRLAIAYNNGDNLNTNPITSIQGLDGWNINTTSSVTMYAMFLYTNVFNRPLASWNMTRVNNTNLMFRDALKFNQPLSNWERAGSTLANITNMSGMFCNAYEFNQSIGNWNVSSVVKFGELGDGGMFSNARAFNNGNDTYPLSNWSINSVNSVTMAYMFSSNTTSIFNRDISTWNMTKVTNTSFMFSGTYAFDQPLDNWERTDSTMGNITTMSSMFQTALAFNQNIGAWNVSKVTTFASMFNGASNFTNGDDTAPINNWVINTIASVNMTLMFANASNFNRDISSWNISKVTATTNMFNNADAFNQPLNSWNTSEVINMQGMFQNTTAFNQNIGNWNVSNVTVFESMFQSSGFNNNGSPDINNWIINTTLGANVNMKGLFSSAGSFNQPLNNWNTSEVINMNGMFQNATTFNQNIGNWNVSKVTNFTNFMLGKTSSTYSSTNLDAIYNGWSALPSLKPNLSISFGTAKYSQAGKPGKDTLLASPNNWTIADGLLNVSGTSNNGGLIRVTTSAVHGFTTGNSVYIYGVNGTTNANGTWTVTVVSTTIIELQGSTYNAAWTSGGNVILG